MEWNVVIALLATISGVILGWTGRAKSNKYEVAQDAAEGATIKETLKYIKEKVDGILHGMKDQGKKLDEYSERLIKAEGKLLDLERRICILEEH